MKHVKRRLGLDRETIKLLTDESFVRVAGGDTPGTSDHMTSQDSVCSVCRWFCPSRTHPGTEHGVDAGGGSGVAEQDHEAHDDRARVALADVGVVAGDGRTALDDGQRARGAGDAKVDLTAAAVVDLGAGDGCG